MNLILIIKRDHELPVYRKVLSIYISLQFLLLCFIIAFIFVGARRYVKKRVENNDVKDSGRKAEIALFKNLMKSIDGTLTI